ncbi:hypothetical protein GQR58_010518 [Nymphon striatum]|nr:hypothetical protein GQR58_010518 [Nymphon striatum]
MNISGFIQNEEEASPDSNYGNGYRCSAYLNDGTFRPCVIIRKNQKYIDLACRRIKEEIKGKSIFANKKEGYRETIKTFVTSGNNVNDYDIKSVEKSRFAIPLSILDKIEGETTEFFDLPNGYTFNDVNKIHNHSYVGNSGEIVSLLNDMNNLTLQIEASMFDKPILFLATSNQSASRIFYESKIGLNFVSSDPYALVFNVGEFELRIQVVKSVIAIPYTSLGWSVNNLEKTIEKLSSNGVEFELYENLEQDKHKIWHSPSGAKIAWFKDPDKNILSLTEYQKENE